MFERFTEKAVKTIMLAQEEARRMGWPFVGTEHILLGLIGENTGVAATSLKHFEISLKDARTEVTKILGQGPGNVPAEIPFTPRCKRLLELAWRSSEMSEKKRVDTGHLLLGLIKEAKLCAEGPLIGKNGLAHRVLVALSVDPDALNAKVLSIMDPADTPNGDFKDADPSEEILDAINTVLDQNASLITAAQNEAERLRHNFVGTELLLLGIISQPNTTASRTLHSVGANLPATRIEVEKIIGYGNGFMGFAHFTPRVKRVIVRLASEVPAETLKSFGPESILIGILSEDDGVAITALQNLGINIQEVKRMLVDEIGR